ncbi:DUF6602 domain-containing protein [Pseudomonas syringae]|uniref:DUF6602 domain-containing protein n=1 Tax=Pseudomonas syringae TaxID=317 RepID=UPI0007EE4995|nr:DUF6602 domain-containing protein [Pseudomonas syringae]OBS32838.1 hypothetical protein A9K81_21315 [Pseudomonas syringae pv. syringae]
MSLTNPPPSLGGLPHASPDGDRNFLDHYFASVYSKLEADALLFNRELPHNGLKGSENENALAAVIRGFLPSKYGVEVNALVIDQFGKVSKQADIVIYDAATQASFFRKVFPVEIVYAVIEVKTSMSSTEAQSAMDNLASISDLEFRPSLSPYWQTRVQSENIHHNPPGLYAFSYRTDCQSFETFSRWFDWPVLFRGVELRDKAPAYPEIRILRACSLDQGVIHMESSNGHVQRWIAEAVDGGVNRSFKTTLQGEEVLVDPAKALFIFLQRLWDDLQTHKLHPGFDIRSYMSSVLGTVIDVPEHMISKSGPPMLPIEEALPEGKEEDDQPTPRQD